jgi:Leucine-rich repeat (LRR) protein
MFSVIDGGGFRHLEGLTKLDISGCSPLKEITKNAFSTLANLEYVKISSNRKLEFIHPEAFGSKPLLKHVDLSNNALSSVSPAKYPNKVN